jgi:hypothetical protein
MLEIVHNFDPRQFMWLWAKYVIGFDERYHCTNSIRGRYSKKFSKNNPHFAAMSTVLFDEEKWGGYQAIYICGVSRQGYRNKENYPHNVHAAIRPAMGAEDRWSFEGWKIAIHNGRFLPIPPSPDCLPDRYRSLSDEFTTCRIFRWAACYFNDQDSVSLKH